MAATMRRLKMTPATQKTGGLPAAGHFRCSIRRNKPGKDNAFQNPFYWQ